MIISQTRQELLILEYLKTLYYEFKSKFVLQKVHYKVEGSCKKCGKCCRHMYSIDTYTKNEFKITQMIYPKYKRFYVINQDENGNLIFACNLVNDDGSCSVYNKRLSMCKKYPHKNIRYGTKLPEYCGFKVIPDKKFEDYITN